MDASRNYFIVKNSVILNIDAGLQVDIKLRAQLFEGRLALSYLNPALINPVQHFIVVYFSKENEDQ